MDLLGTSRMYQDMTESRTLVPQDKHKPNVRKKVKDVQIYLLSQVEDFRVWQSYLARAAKGLGIPHILHTSAIRKKMVKAEDPMNPGKKTRGAAQRLENSKYIKREDSYEPREAPELQLPEPPEVFDNNGEEKSHEDCVLETQAWYAAVIAAQRRHANEVKVNAMFEAQRSTPS